MTAISTTAVAIDYPESDGKPVGETDAHRREILYIVDTIDRYFADAADVYVSGNLMFYYEEGVPSSVVSPDVFVVKGVKKGLRRIYKLWEEGQAPCVVIEMTSRSTRLEDKGNKRALYAMLGVREYFMFDPLAEYMKPPLQGFALVGTEYAAMLPDSSGMLISRELGMKLYRDDTYLRLIDLKTGEQIVRTDDLGAALRAAEEQARAAEQQARAAEEQARAAEEQARTEAAARRAAEDELERLRAELRRLQGKDS